MKTLYRSFTAALLSFFLLVLPGFAQQSVINDWTNPGQYPFTGSLQDACTLHANTITKEQCFRAMDRYEKKECTAMYLQDGEIIDVSFTTNGVHKKRTLRVKFGTGYSRTDPIRRALLCETGRADGASMVRPDICGNWSVMTVPLFQPQATPPPAPEIPAAVSPPARKAVWRCDQVPFSQVGAPTYVQQPGTIISGCVNTYIPGTTMSFAGSRSHGVSQACGWRYED